MSNEEFMISYKLSQGGYNIILSNGKIVLNAASISFDLYKRRFTMLKGEATVDGLKEYLKIFNIWCEELIKRENGKINYKFYFNDGFAVIQTFMNTLEKIKNINIDSFDDVDLLEMKYMNMCHNGGLTFAKKGIFNCYGYDVKSCYPRLLGSKTDRLKLQIPTKRGKEYFLKAIDFDEPLKFGYYRIKITSEHPDALKIFAFSKKSCYTNYSIKFALDMADEFLFKLELICDDKPNAYLYDDECIIESHKIFNPWFYKLKKMREDLPKNGLLKHLMSSLSGHLMAYNMESIPMNNIPDSLKDKLCAYADEMPAEAEYAIYDKVYNDQHPEMSYYKILNLKKPMEHKLGRLKCFLMSFARNMTATGALVDLKNIVRIQTDNITFTKEQDFNECYTIPREFFYEEKKTTGNIEIFTANTLKHICSCGYKDKYDQFIKHSC